MRLMTFVVAATALILPAAAQAQDTARARIALYQLAGQKNDSTLAAVLSTVADSVELSLDVLQRYEVTRLPAADPAADLPAVKAYCEAHRVDQAILGRGAARTGGGYDFRLVVYDRRKDAITVDTHGSSTGVLDMFDATDTLVAAMLDGLSGTHLLFGSLTMETDPAGAMVAINGKDVGPSPLSLRGLPVGTLQVSARADRRDEAQATVTISDGQTTDQSLSLARSTGTLSVKAPADAVVTVRSAEIGEKNLQGTAALQLPTGDYDVAATDEGLPTVTGKLSIERGQSLPWQPWNRAYLAIRTAVPGAAVSVDGQDKGAAPQVVEVDPGTLHRVALSAAHFRPFVADLSAAAADKTTFDAELTPNPGSIKVVTSVPGAEVDLDSGKQKAVSPAAFNDLPAGPHLITLGPVTANNRILTAGDPVTVEVKPDEQSLVTKTMVQGLGRLTIVGAPPGSTVQVEGTPLAMPEALTSGANAPAGEVEVAVDGPATQRWTQTISVPLDGDLKESIYAMSWHLPRRTVRLDGNPEGWTGLTPVWLPVHQFGFPSQPGTDLVRGFACRDDEMLYVRYEFANGRPSTRLERGINDELQYMADIITGQGEVQAKVRFRRSGASSELGLWNPQSLSWGTLGKFTYTVGEGSLEIAVPLAPIRKYLAGGLIAIKLLILNEDSNGKWLSTIQSDQQQVSFDLPAVQSGRMYVPVIAKGMRHPFWQNVMKGAQAAAAQYGLDITFEGPETEADVQPQSRMLQNDLAKNPAAICLAALDTRAVRASLAQAILKHIPVIGLDSGVPDAPAGAIYATAATNNHNAGGLAADKMFDVLKARIAAASDSSPVEIVVLSTDSTTTSIQDRGRGFRDRMIQLITSQTAHPAADIAVTGNPAYVSSDSPTTGKAIVIDMEVAATARAADVAGAAGALVKRAGAVNIVGVFCSNQATVEGILAATNGGADLPTRHRGMVVVGFDAGRAQKAAVRNGYLLGSVTQDPYQMGFKAVELAYKALQKQPVSDVDTGARFYDATTMNEPDIGSLLYD